MYEWLERHSKTVEHCIVTIVHLDSLSSLFSSKYCYEIEMDQLNMSNIKHRDKINTHTQRSSLLYFLLEKTVCAAI